MKIFTVEKNQSIECNPTQEALEAKKINTFGRKLVIKGDTGFLIPEAIKHGGGFCFSDELKYIPKVNIFNLFKVIKIIKYNQELIDFKIRYKERKDKYVMPVINLNK